MLVISSGDVSDVDGFMAVAEYARSGADLLFVMNYPAFMCENSPELAYGLGYGYGADAVAGVQLRRKYSDLAAAMCKGVWEGTTVMNGVTKGKLYFMIGGINTISPFSLYAMKDELQVYKDVAVEQKLSVVMQNTVYLLVNENFILQRQVGDIPWYRSFLSTYAGDIYMDFNGSMAFLWPDDVLDQIKPKAMFVMGGVHSWDPPKTKGAIPGILNRLSCATMNQVYAPAQSARLFEWMKKSETPTYIVSNNVVSEFKDVEAFLTSHNINSPYLLSICKMYYQPNTARKAFDLYCAKALTRLWTTSSVPNTFECVLYYDDQYGVSLISRNATWSQAFEEYLLNDNNLERERSVLAYIRPKQLIVTCVKDTIMSMGAHLALERLERLVEKLGL